MLILYSFDWWSIWKFLSSTFVLRNMLSYLSNAMRSRAHVSCSTQPLRSWLRIRPQVWIYVYVSSLFFCLRGLAMGRPPPPPVGVPLNCIKSLIVLEVNSASKQATEPNPWNKQPTTILILITAHIVGVVVAIAVVIVVTTTAAAVGHWLWQRWMNR